MILRGISAILPFYLKEPPMTGRKSSVFAFVAIVSLAAAAHAGAPLKGVDVKLGKNPGGGASARTTNGDGKINFGVLKKGEYYVIISAPKGTDLKKEPEAQIEIKGATGGTIRKRWDYAKKKAFDASPAASSARAAAEVGEEKIIFTSDGSHPVEIAATTISKSRSNTKTN